MVVSLYLHALSHRQLYVTFSSRIEHGLDDPFYFNGLNKGLKFCYGSLVIPAWTMPFPAGLNVGWMIQKSGSLGSFLMDQLQVTN